MKYFKVWAEIEVIDVARGTYKRHESMDSIGALGIFKSLRQAQDFVQFIAIDSIPQKKSKRKKK